LASQRSYARAAVLAKRTRGGCALSAGEAGVPRGMAGGSRRSRRRGPCARMLRRTGAARTPR